MMAGMEKQERILVIDFGSQAALRMAVCSVSQPEPYNQNFSAPSCNRPHAISGATTSSFV